MTYEEASHRGCGEGDSSRAHGLPDGHHDHELHGLRTLLDKESPAVLRGILYLEEQRYQQRDADHRYEGGDKGDLGDHRRILAVFQTEDGAVGGYGHGDDQRIDVHHKRIEAYEPHQEM